MTLNMPERCCEKLFISILKTKRSGGRITKLYEIGGQGLNRWAFSPFMLRMSKRVRCVGFLLATVRCPSSSQTSKMRQEGGSLLFSMRLFTSCSMTAEFVTLRWPREKEAVATWNPFATKLPVLHFSRK